MSSPILDALWTKINTTSGSGFLNDLGGRVWLDLAPDDAALPLCVYSGQTTRFERAGAGWDHTLRVVFSFYVFADTNADIVATQNKLRSLLDGAVLVATGYDRIICLLRSRGVPTLQDEAWTLTEEYELRGRLTT